VAPHQPDETKPIDKGRTSSAALPTVEGGHAAATGASRGRFGPYGGQYVPETLMGCLFELEEAYQAACRSSAFQDELDRLLKDYSGRPTPLTFAGNLTARWSRGRTRIYLKREDLNHTGAHKINNCLGQILLARKMGKSRIVAETGAGQHGVATASVAALFNMTCLVYMGEKDMLRQKPNVLRMRLHGAEVVPVRSGTGTLKDATSETIRDWVTNVRDTHYIIGSTVGPHPYPTMVRDFQRIIGVEARRQILDAEGCLPTHVVACVGGGSNAMGIFTGFFEDQGVRLVGVEAGGSSSGHSAALCRGTPGVLHGSFSYLLHDADGQVQAAHSIAPGLDYPGVGPEHSHLKDAGRVSYGSVSDDEALEAFSELCRFEGILPALESSHALAWTKSFVSAPCEPVGAGRSNKGQNERKPDPRRLVLVNLSGRGDKDIEAVKERLDR